jgi:hypothetical protein
MLHVLRVGDICRFIKPSLKDVYFKSYYITCEAIKYGIKWGTFMKIYHGNTLFNMPHLYFSFFLCSIIGRLIGWLISRLNCWFIVRLLVDRFLVYYWWSITGRFIGRLIGRFIIDWLIGQLYDPLIYRLLMAEYWISVIGGLFVCGRFMDRLFLDLFVAYWWLIIDARLWSVP